MKTETLSGKLPDINNVFQNAQAISEAIALLASENKLSKADKEQLIVELQETIAIF